MVSNVYLAPGQRYCLFNLDLACCFVMKEKNELSTRHNVQVIDSKNIPKNETSNIHHRQTFECFETKLHLEFWNFSVF